MEIHCFMDIKFEAEDIKKAKLLLSCYLIQSVVRNDSVLNIAQDIKGDIEIHPADKCAEYNW